jgi:hypothetical protein
MREARSLRGPALFLAFCLAASAACTTNNTVIYEVSDAGTASLDAEAGGGGACEDYLTCLKHLADQTGQSAAYDQAATLYGSSGGCAQSASSMDACESACRQAMDELRQTGSDCSASTGEGGDGGASDAADGSRDATAPTCATYGTSCSTKPCCVGTCTNGACLCPSGQSLCGNTCARLDSDLSNCGACGKVCNPHGEGFHCGPVPGVNGSKCWAFPFSSPSQITCNDVCGGQGLVCYASPVDVAIYGAPATGDAYVACDQVPTATYQGGTFAQVHCGCYEP